MIGSRSSDFVSICVEVLSRPIIDDIRVSDIDVPSAHNAPNARNAPECHLRVAPQSRETDIILRSVGLGFRGRRVGEGEGNGQVSLQYCHFHG